MKAFEIGELMERRAAHGRPALEFLRERSMSLSLYTLPAGGPDPQHHGRRDQGLCPGAGPAARDPSPGSRHDRHGS
jgi:hypothetical protein